MCEPLTRSGSLGCRGFDSPNGNEYFTGPNQQERARQAVQPAWVTRLKPPSLGFELFHHGGNGACVWQVRQRADQLVAHLSEQAFEAGGVQAQGLCDGP